MVQFEAPAFQLGFAKKPQFGIGGYISRANAHSVFSFQSGGLGNSSYSTPGYSRNGRWNAYTAPAPSRQPNTTRWAFRICMRLGVLYHHTGPRRRPAFVICYPALSVGHGINDVVDADANPEGRKFLVVLRVIGVFPRIAEIHVVADGHHQAAFVIEI